MGLISDEVIARCDAEMICRSLGIRLGRRTGDRIQMICPFPDHQDEKFGNCQLNTTKKLFYCFACARGGSIIDIVMLHHGWNKDDKAKSYDAMKECCEICGVDDGFVSKDKSFKKTLVPPSLTDEELKVLGLSTEYVEDPKDPEKKYNPITRLRMEDEEGYCYLILEKARSVVEKNRMHKLDSLMYISNARKPVGNLDLLFLNMDTTILKARNIEDRVYNYLMKKEKRRKQT